MLGMGDAPLADEPPPSSYPAASAPAKICVSLAGPIGLVLLGAALLFLPLLLGTPQLSVRFPSDESIEPRAVPLLYQHQEAAHWRGQLYLWQDTGLEYALRLLTFRPLPGYGGYLGFIATTSAAAQRSPGNALTLLGLFALTHGLANLLPFPTQGGGRACMALWEGISGRQLSAKTESYLLLIGMIPLLIIALRIIWLDLSWLAGFVF
jgi:membrane-associated protease RseP (regulator of RpoE activity)